MLGYQLKSVSCFACCARALASSEHFRFMLCLLAGTLKPQHRKRAMGIGGFKTGCKLASAKSDSLETTGGRCAKAVT